MSLRRKPLLSNTKRIKLAQLFSNIGREMAASFKTLASVKHGPSKGSDEEATWIDWLNHYLPKRYAVGSGFITDSKGNQSLQQDIIIFDRQYSPLLLVRKEMLFVPSESVYAVIEVKTNLNASQIRDAARKIESVKGLLRSPAQSVAHAGGIFPPQERGRIFGYVVANTSVWIKRGSWPGLERCLGRYPEHIDGGCILDSGAFSLGAGSKEMQLIIDKKHPLFGFFGLLFEDMKTLGTTPPWDLGQYSIEIQRLRTYRSAPIKSDKGAKSGKLP